MKGDRELLELAAKAAGLNGTYYKAKRMVREFVFVDDEGIIPCGRTALSLWNPLVDDGCALRLSVKLGIHIRHWVYACEAEDNGGRSTGMIHARECNGDMVETTRRAIVRAAAAIGEAMK